MAMRTPRSESDNRPPKRMRLGTRSCAECRRRKVRCIFPPNSQVCEQCALHDTPCQAQQPSQDLGKAPVDRGRKTDVLQKLEDLEGMVRHICKAINLKIESSSLADFETSATEALRRLRPASTSETSVEEDLSTRRTDSLNVSDSDGLTTSSDQRDCFEDAPLLRLFKDAMLIQRDHVQDYRHRLGFGTDQSIKTCIKTLDSLIPRRDDLMLILEHTEKYWPLWPVCPVGPVTSSDRLQQGGIAAARDYIFDSMRSGSPTIVAKAVLWLALCVQQLTRDFRYQRTDLPASPNTLMDAYMSGAETLLSVHLDSRGTNEGLEALALQTKLYINMGKPRKAWLTVRRALNFALLLGLHHPEDRADERQKALWSLIWQSDRQLSLLLGFPYAIADSHPGLSKEHAGQSVVAQVMHEMSIIAGHIGERNQNYRSVTYSVTVQIDQELERCKDGIPPGWWDDAISSPAMSVEDVYSRQIVKIQFYQLYKLLHLPYMLKSSVDRRFESSRIAALEASREMIKCYQALRNSSGPALMICDLIDFEVFSAAMVIVIDLLSSKSSHSDASQQAEDWELVHGVTRTLKHVSREIECSVAGQAAQLLEYLSMARHGTYSSPERYEAVIPYFGKVRISRPARAAASSSSQTELSTTPPNGSGPQLPPPQPFPNMVEFSANAFVPFSPNATADGLSDAELGIDWTSVFDVDSNYDWSQLFETAGAG
ncbi:hypothetical protein VTN00DRAFT_7575 [Thermoascus crustaceus]|uniref:uncharacterized protein n=1 Tax=Thermoascus crustaceus TaxID=5088 RepID=UPI0037423A7C